MLKSMYENQLHSDHRHKVVLWLENCIKIYLTLFYSNNNKNDGPIV